MEFSTKLHTVKSGWPIVYIEGSYVIIFFKKYCKYFSENQFVLANSVDPDEIPQYWGITSGSSLFASIHVKGFPVLKGLIMKVSDTHKKIYL